LQSWFQPIHHHIPAFTGYQVNNVIQCQPPASITALNISTNWGLVGFGTAHGFVLFDYLQVTCCSSV